ncbi:MAG: hypothetical protein RML93_08060 [Anaerolineales bacterium]|nr:hypothetical protein [Anaerolineales bacterium]MCS7247189.1 hypothetical protein [Anaerolineales bacterium]MDW8161000.1 hypothetical protein [Anaerolineales bacterium]MDW8447229.1 hypothetical protein [Anaerolineales bacterium]
MVVSQWFRNRSITVHQAGACITREAVEIKSFAPIPLPPVVHNSPEKVYHWSTQIGSMSGESGVIYQSMRMEKSSARKVNPFISQTYPSSGK